MYTKLNVRNLFKYIINNDKYDTIVFYYNSN